MPSMLSAPATIPATREDTFKPGFAPLSVGTVRNSSANDRRPTTEASFMTGTRPAADTRFGSSNTADTTRRLWESCTSEMPFVPVESVPRETPFFQRQGHSRCHDPPRTGPTSVDPG